MIRGLGVETTSTYSQTFNGCDRATCLSEVVLYTNERAPSGPFLVSRTGDAGWTERWVKAPKSTLIRPHKRCWLIQTAGRWPWKSETAKECVTTHLPNQLALKMDGAQALCLYPAVGASDQAPTSRRAWRSWTQPLARAWVKRPLVQILVVVANIQTRTLKAEVEKGSVWTALGHGWVDPKPQGNPVRMRGFLGLRSAKGNQVNIPGPERGYPWSVSAGLGVRQRKRTRGRQRRPWKEFSFLFDALSAHRGIWLTGETVAETAKPHTVVWGSGASPTALENSGERLIFASVRTHNRSRSPRWAASGP